MRIIVLFIALLGITSQASASSSKLAEYILGTNFVCASRDEPVIIFTDVTTKGENDDTTAIKIYAELEKARCVKINAIVSIFGNGNSSTDQIHKNLIVRLAEFGINWNVLHGPNNRMSHERSGKPSAIDVDYLTKIAEVISSSPRPTTLVELGPMTPSASLLRYRFGVKPEKIKKIIGVGGRSPGEHFATGRGPFGWVSVRDMNVAEDRAALTYLWKHHPKKLWMVTYRSGVGEREVPAQLLTELGNKIAEHAEKRAGTMRGLGYTSIPSWDPWTTLHFVKGGAKRLGCRTTPARVRYDESGRFKPSDRMQLQLLAAPDQYSHNITACHERGR